MKKRYLPALLLTLLSTEISAQRLLVSITIEELNAGKMEAASRRGTSESFRRMMEQAVVYTNAAYAAMPADHTSAIAVAATGAAPELNGVTGSRWFDRERLRPIECTADGTPQALTCATLGDELKVETDGKALVFGLARRRDAAIMHAGHAANAAIWQDEKSGKWRTSDYYAKDGLKWLQAFSALNGVAADNDALVKLALQCIDSNMMGGDEVCDLLALHLENDDYGRLDHTLATLIKGVESRVGAGRVVFSIAGTTGAEGGIDSDTYRRYRIPTGTFYINRTGELLNMFLGATYGRNQYVEGYFRNQIFLHRKLLEQRRINRQELYERCREFLTDCDGVSRVKTSADVLPPRSGDIVVELMPGWSLVNENPGDKVNYRTAAASTPIVIMGAGIKPQRITSPVTIDRLAPTLAGCIHIRAPNAATSQSLF